MKEMFNEYYRPTDGELKQLWDEAIFVFDANVLLNLYRYSYDTSEKMLEIMDILSSRSWIPYRVAYEYQKNRISEIIKQETVYEKLENELEKSKEDVRERLSSFREHPFLNFGQIQDNLENQYNIIIKNIKEERKKHPNWFGEDVIRDRLSIIFKDVGESYFLNNRRNSQNYRRVAKREI